MELRGWWRGGLVGIALLVVLACQIGRPPGGVTPGPTPTRWLPPTPTGTPTWTPLPPLSVVTFTPTPTVVLPTRTPTPRPSPTPTRGPTPTVAVAPRSLQERTGAVLARLAALGIEPHCLLWTDSDGDGEREWVGLYREAVGSSVLGFVLDGETLYTLSPPDTLGVGLGERPTCNLQVRPLSPYPVILVWGSAGAHLSLLHLFRWNGRAYQVVGAFGGDGGISFVAPDPGSGLPQEIIVRQRGDPDRFDREEVWRWDGERYRLDRSRYVFSALRARGAPYPDRSPGDAVISFYLAINDRDLPGAYALFTPQAQASRPRERWYAGFATTLGVEVNEIRTVSETAEDTATIVVRIRAQDNRGARVEVTFWEVTWTVVATPDGWRLDRSTPKRIGSE